MVSIKNENETHAEEQARFKWKMILEKMDVVDGGDSKESEEMIDSVREEALDVCVSAPDWRPVSTPAVDTTYRILLCTGGPAVQVTGDLDENMEPVSARLESQDWGTPWVEYRKADEAILIEFARCFYFGE